MPGYSSSRRSKSRNSRSISSPKRAANKKNQSRQKPVEHLSPEVKKDIVGGLLAVMGIVSFISYFSTDPGVFTGFFSQMLRRIAGWGGVILPLALLAIGLWLLFRNVDKFPRLSSGQVFGIILLYVNLLTWFHLIQGGGYPAAKNGSGGGFIGAFFDQFLEDKLGLAGAVVFLIAWALIGLVFLSNLTLPEIWNRIADFFTKTKKHSSDEWKPAREAIENSPRKVVFDERQKLPEGFNPIQPIADSEKEMLTLTPRQKSEDKQPVRHTPVTTATSPDSKVGDHSQVTHVQHKPQKPWPMPAVDEILDPATPVTFQGHVDKDRARLIEETLASFSAPARVVEIHRGPTVTQFGVEPEFVESRTGRMRVRVSKIVSLADDLALALAAPRIRIQAPVPGRSYVGIEVPNPEIAVVGLREVLESEPYRKVKSSLKLALGKDVAGKPICADLTSMPHLLIAGTTNSGKSVCVNSILTSLLLNNSPADLRLVLVDPKRVELTGYNRIPHLLAPVVVDAEKVISALQWVIREMDARYHKFSNQGVRNILEFNRSSTEEHLPYIVVVIDELADLMMLAPDETERCITRLAQLARATGIHLIIATQRPSVDVLTGLIKANLPARIAFMVASNVDSRVILDQPGAEKLLGRGDMLYQAPDSPAPVRLQGTYVSDGEIHRLVESWKAIAANNADAAGTDPFANASFEMLPAGVPLKQGALWDDGASTGDDLLLKDAIGVVRREGKASISLVQRRLRVGYTRAARLIDTMEERGIVGPQQTGSQVREVLDFGDEEKEPELQDQ